MTACHPALFSPVTPPHVLPVEKMPEALLSGAHTFAVRTEIPNEPKAASGMNRILMQLRTSTGHDFSHYKKSTIGRRIERRMSQHNIEDTEIYARYLKENPAEVNTLFKELLINVTNFFRDAEAFAALEKDILPLLCKDKPDDYLFRCLGSRGCATGEEAYSIAILLRELMEQSHRNSRCRSTVPTWMMTPSLSPVRAFIHPISPRMLLLNGCAVFIKEDAGFRVKKEVREMVVFAIQNVIKDPPFTRLDLLSCRNLMIYLEPELQNRLIPAFHYALKPGGVLFLSPSESIGNHTDLFSSLNRKWKFYRATHSITSSRAAMANVLSWAAETAAKHPRQPLLNQKKSTLPNLPAGYWCNTLRLHRWSPI